VRGSEGGNGKGKNDGDAGGRPLLGDEQGKVEQKQESKFPQFSAADLGIGISSFGDSTGGNMPWDVVNRLLWIMDDVVSAKQNNTSHAAQMFLADVTQVNPHLKKVLFESQNEYLTPNPNNTAYSELSISAVLLANWFEAWKKRWDEDSQAVQRFLRLCDHRERYSKGK